MPRIALVSDVHANLPAFQAVIEELNKYSPEIWVCSGDIVGYGPHPVECIELVRELDMICVLGNHDAGVLGSTPLDHFRNPNRKLIEITSKLISEKHKKWLNSLPLTKKYEDLFTLAHSSPIEPGKWKYLQSAFQARAILDDLETKYCFIGHTHMPGIVSEKVGVQQVNREGKFLINPGSVGQPRDGDPRASCGLLDTENHTYNNFRLSFNIEVCISDLMEMGFSQRESSHLIKARG